MACHSVDALACIIHGTAAELEIPNRQDSGNYVCLLLVNLYWTGLQ